MSTLLIKAAALVLIALAFLGLAPWVTRAHWWEKIEGATITCGGQLSTASHVYRSRYGSLLVLLREQNGDEGIPYLIFPESKKVALPNRNRFFTLAGFISGYLYCRDEQASGVFMDEPKADLKPDLIIQPDSIEYTGINSRRIKVVL